MPPADAMRPSQLPRITSQALAMRPETRRVFIVVAVIAVCAATAIGAGVGWVGDVVSGGSPAEAAAASLWGGMGAFVASLLGVVAIPIARRLLIARADVQLVEAASPLHPLIRRLMSEAPGTYAHSLATATLAEAAAEAVGADALLARVGAYYHDVGKIMCPCFFFENLATDANPHDGAQPSLSAMIITAHVADGLALADEYALPVRVRDIIREHHGTSLVRYFFNKASEIDAGAAEGDFRYPGGRPTSREAALVMLADACEAAVRALPSLVSENVERTVHDVITEKADDGQLEQSGLAQEDLIVVTRTFTSGLVSMLHARCEYPRLVPTSRRSEHADQRCESSRA